MSKNAVWLLIAIILVGCAHNQNSHPKQNVKKMTNLQPSTTTALPQSTVFTVPDWFLNLPDGGLTAIGIAPDKLYKEDESRQLAKEHAAVLLSRCHGSFNVCKTATVTSDAEAIGSDEQSAKFDVIVSSDMNFLKEMADSLKIYDHFLLHNYYISLLGCDTGKPQSKMCEISTDTLPDWCQQNAIQINGSEVLALGIGKSEDLISAWNKAYDTALKQLARYKEMQVSGVTRETYDNQSKSVSLETSTVLGDVKPVNHYVTYQTKEGFTTYQVWCRLKYHSE